jgi:Family of unknown function (DUF6982)
MHRIVAHFQDGHVMKGFTADFLPAKSQFHMTAEQPSAAVAPTEVRVPELKALFFVKNFEGDPKHQRSNDPSQGGAGRRLRVVFKDGEVMVGTTQGYDRSRPGFFVIPVDAAGNNERCFVVAGATQEVAFL